VPANPGHLEKWPLKLVETDSPCGNEINFIYYNPLFLLCSVHTGALVYQLKVL